MTATVALAPLAKQRFVDNNGNPLANGKIFTYAAGTTTKQNTYADTSGSTPNANPVILDARGEAFLGVDQTLSYKFVAAPANDTDPPTNPFWVVDNIPAAASIVPLSLSTFTTNLQNTTGSSLVGFIQSGTSAQGRTTQGKLRDNVHLNDFLTAAQIADVAAGTLTLGCSAALVAARAALPSAGGIIWLPRGKVLLDAVISWTGPGRVRLIGEGFAEANNNTGATELVKAASLTSAVFNITAPGMRCEHFVLRGASGNTGDGIQISANSVSLDNVLVCGMGQDGVRIGLDAGTNANSWDFKNCRFFSNTRDGLNISDGVSPTAPNANAGHWLNCVSQSNGRDGVRLNNAALNTFTGGTVESNGSVGIRLNGAGCNYNEFRGVDFDSGNAAGKARVETGALYNRIESATLLDTEVVDNGTQTMLVLPNSSNAGWYSKGIFRMQLGNPGGASDIISSAGGGYTRFGYGGDATGGALTDATAQIVVASNGLHLGKSTSGLIGFFDKTPIAKPTITGSKGGNAALTSLLTALATYGLIVDGST
jgi:hypothetical protein